VGERALSVGEAAPDFTLNAATGASWTLSASLEQKPVVLLFYRGHW